MPPRDAELLERHQPILLATRGDRYLEGGVRVYAERRGAWLEYWLAYPGDPDHTGVDAELVLIRLDYDEPVEAVYAKHRSAHRRAWPDVRRDGQRPKVYVGKHKHASYFEPGWYHHGLHIERAAGDLPIDAPLIHGVPVALQGRLAYRDPDRWVAATV